MSLKDNKNRREQIRCLRSKRTALLKARDLSIKGRMYTQEQAQEQTQEQAQEQTQELTRKPTRISVYDRYVR